MSGRRGISLLIVVALLGALAVTAGQRCRTHGGPAFARRAGLDRGRPSLRNARR